MNEQWKRWEPLPELIVNYSLEHVHNGMRGLEILLTDPNNADKKVRVLFAYTMISYTISNLVDEPMDTNKSQNTNEASFCNSWAFFEVAHSKYISHLMEQSATIVEIYDPRHFVILTTNAKIDVVASYEPDVTCITMDLAAKTLLYKEMTIPYIIRTLSTAHIILYEPVSKNNTQTQQLNLALDCGAPIDAARLKAVEKDLKSSDVPLPCTILDLCTLTHHEQRKILNKCIVWRK